MKLNVTIDFLNLTFKAALKNHKEKMVDFVIRILLMYPKRNILVFRKNILSPLHGGYKNTKNTDTLPRSCACGKKRLRPELEAP